MENKYYLRYILGTVKEVIVYADTVILENGSYKFVKDAGSVWIPIAYYPIQNTVIYKIEKNENK